MLRPRHLKVRRQVTYLLQVCGRQHVRKNGCLVTESKAGPERYKGLNLRRTEEALDAITDINLHLDGQEGHVYLCRYSDPALDGIGTDKCSVPLNPMEIPYKFSGRFRGAKAF